MISVIISTFNEEVSLEGLLQQLAACATPHEVLVADGASTDGTVPLAQRYARVLACQRNRGGQFNCAAREARGEVLLFLHADVHLPLGALAAVERGLADPVVVGGNFGLEFAGGDFSDRAFTVISRWRRWFGIFYGDSGIFVRRAVFDRLGGFREWPLMEDYEFARRLVKAGKTVCLPERLRVSSRRWQRRRLWRTMTSWFFIHTLYYLGVSPHWLVRWYAPVRPKRAERKE